MTLLRQTAEPPQTTGSSLPCCSLYVTLELVKLLQCIYLARDRHMYDAASDTPFVYKTTTLNEDLGQVEYVLSDKTGKRRFAMF